MVNRARIAVGLLAGLVLLASTPSASAACGAQGNILLIPKCFIEENLEDVVEALNAQMDGDVAFVYAQDFRFHPENVTIRSGGSVVFFWLDNLGGNQNHDPRNSGTTGSQTLDLLKPKPIPELTSKCFDIVDRPGHLLLGQGGAAGNGDTWNLTFRFTPATGLVERSEGLMTGSAPVVGEPPQAGPFLDCPAGTSSNSAAAAVIPYHCGLHGSIGNNLGMRASITVVV